MKTKYFILAAFAGFTLASCTSDEFIGNNDTSPTTEVTDGAIKFGGGFKAVTRADYLGKDAADKLNNKFIVGGFKDDGTTVTEVFDDYIVNWVANTAGTTQSNTSDWDYVGVSAAAPSSIAGKAQAIKYWDFSTTQYDFAAYSTSNHADVVTTGWASGKLLVSDITKATAGDGPTYYIKGDKADLAKVYISDLTTSYKNGAGMSPAQPKYQDEVLLTFRNLTCKARVALYETIPGYSVKDVKFYTANDAPALGAATATSVTLFAPNSAATDVFYTSGKATVTFPTRGASNVNESDYNKAHVTISEATSVKNMAFGDLIYTTAERDEKTASYGTNYLARHSNTPSFANTGKDGNYEIVMPNENGAVLELRIDYTLVPIDGASETIKVNGATAYVPAHFAAWKSNYAYTYIFKISDNTNGWTSTDTNDPKGLFPITFDAVVVETTDHEQTTITTVAMPTITTYQVGHNYSAQETYAAGDIYIQAMDNSSDPATIIDLSASNKSKLYVVSGTGAATATEADIMDALNIRTNTGASPIKGRNGLILTTTDETAAALTLSKASPLTFTTIPCVDGNTIAVGDGVAGKFTAASGTVYAFVYEVSDAGDTNIISYVTLSSEPEDWSGNYYKDTDPTCAGSPVSTYAAGSYYRKYTNSNTTYGVKVIKVQ